ncbi:MAG TPA: hypothetical protein VMH00_05785 [Candidatus Limnocylindrales bacterium]|nr:hypothetical protein [Candidatus Limnocylindrales bacterium]
MPPRSDETQADGAGNNANERAGAARTAPADELKLLIHDADEGVLLTLLENPNLEEGHVTQLLDRLDLTANVLSAVAEQRKWISREAVRLRLARHPRTPKRIALALVRQLYLFNLVRLSLLPSAPADIRRIAEEIIIMRVPHVPVGEKLTLARRGPSRVAGAVLAEGHPQAVKLALDNAFLSESQILKVLAKASVPERVVVAIAQHPKWSTQYNVRVALIRNKHTPAGRVMAFLPNITLRDLKDVGLLETLAPHTKRYIQQELKRRMEGKRGA